MQRIITGDILAFARHYKGPRFHAVLCDPPYHLTSIVKRFGAPNAAPAQYGRDGAFARVSTGFMGQTWDGGDVAFRPDTWAAIASLVYPGAHLLAFGGDRTHHRLMCAIEDAGWEIRTCVYWIFGSGFPKSLSIQGQLRKTYLPDARCACVRHSTGTDAGSQDGYPSVPHSRDAQPRTVGDNVQDGPPSQDGVLGHSHRDLPPDGLASERASIFLDEDNDHLSNGSSPCRVEEARNYQSNGSILSGTPENKSRASRSANRKTVSDRCDIEHLVSGSVSSSCQSPSSMDTNIPRCETCGKWIVPDWSGYGTALKPAAEIIVIARLPVQGTVAENCLRYGTGALNIEGCRVETQDRVQLSASEGVPFGDDHYETGTGRKYREESKGRWPANVAHDGSEEVLAGFPGAPSAYPGNPGAAERYSGTPVVSQHVVLGDGVGNNAGMSYSDSGSAARFFYCAKASRKEREMGLEGMEERPSQCAVGMKQVTAKNWGDGNEIVYERTTKARNHHPTVKPIALTRWLATLILPPPLDEPRRILVPFAGVMSEALGALLAGWDEIIAVEMDRRYCEIGRARLRWWSARMRETDSSEPGAILRTCGKRSRKKRDLLERSHVGSLFEMPEEE